METEKLGRSKEKGMGEIYQDRKVFECESIPFPYSFIYVENNSFRTYSHEIKWGRKISANTLTLFLVLIR